jgi:hypothetical protein
VSLALPPLPAALVPHDLRIVVPSRRRVGLMPKLLSLLPHATVCVDEEEIAAYRPHVPALWSHPPFANMASTRNWILDQVPESVCVMVDDDLTGVRTMVGRHSRKIDDPHAILQLIVNQAQLARDLKVPVFCWAATGDPEFFKESDPFSFVAPVFGAFGVVARGVRFDDLLRGRSDIDFTMRALLEHRIVLQDRRYHFNTPPYGSAGGAMGLRTAATEADATRALKARWGRYLDVDRKIKEGRGTYAVHIAVSRKNPLASMR